MCLSRRRKEAYTRRGVRGQFALIFATGRITSRRRNWEWREEESGSERRRSVEGQQDIRLLDANRAPGDRRRGKQN